MSPSWLRAIETASTDAIRRAARKESFDPFGLPELRSQIQGWLPHYGAFVETNQMCIVSGTQQALQLIAATVIRPGTTVFVPEMCYLAAQEVFRDYGGRIKTLPVCPNGINLEPLKSALQSDEVSLVYVMPNGHFPTGWSCSRKQKQELLDLAQQFQFAIVEDDYFAGFYYEKTPPQTLMSMANAEVPMYYLCSFSNMLHPSFRLGLMACPQEAVLQMERRKFLADTYSSPVLQYILLGLFESGELMDHLEHERLSFQNARDSAIKSCSKWLPQDYFAHPPECGLAFWVESPSKLGLPFFQSCLHEHVLVMPDESFSLRDTRFGFQVNFAAVDPSSLDEGIHRIARVLRKLQA